MKLTPDGIPELGMVEIATTNFGGHSPEFWAKQLTEKIIGYSEDSAPHIKEQAKAYENLIYKVCLIYLNNAIKSYKASLIQELIQGDAEDLAIILKELK